MREELEQYNEKDVFIRKSRVLIFKKKEKSRSGRHSEKVCKRHFRTHIPTSLAFQSHFGEQIDKRRFQMVDSADVVEFRNGILLSDSLKTSRYT